MGVTKNLKSRPEKVGKIQFFHWSDWLLNVSFFQSNPPIYIEISKDA